MIRSILQKKLTKLEKSHKILFDLLTDVSYDVINTKPSPEKWSIGQISYHVYQAEFLSLQYMKKKSQDFNVLKKASSKEWFKSKLLKTFLGLPVKYKAPKGVSENIPEHVDFKHLEENWINHFTNLKAFVENLPEDKLHHTIFRHPIVGLINIAQTLDFYHAHFKHHLPQIKHLLSKYNRPV